MPRVKHGHVKIPAIPMTQWNPTVAELLAASHRSHWLYHQNLPRMMATPGGTVSAVPGDSALAQQALKDAADFRAQADALDPSHADLAWADEATQFPHDELSQFYSQQIAVSDAKAAAIAAIETSERAALVGPQPVPITDING